MDLGKCTSEHFNIFRLPDSFNPPSRILQRSAIVKWRKSRIAKMDKNTKQQMSSCVFAKMRLPSKLQFRISIFAEWWGPARRTLPQFLCGNGSAGASAARPSCAQPRPPRAVGITDARLRICTFVDLQIYPPATVSSQASSMRRASSGSSFANSFSRARFENLPPFCRSMRKRRSTVRSGISTMASTRALNAS